MRTYSVNNKQEKVLASQSPPSNNDHWKISSAFGNRDRSISPSKRNINHSTSSATTSSFHETYHTQPDALNNGFINRPQSPFSRLDRYKPKSPIITVKASSEPIIPSTTTKMIDIVSVEKPVGTKDTIDYVPWTWWSGSAFMLTCFIPNWILSNCGNKKTSLVQQAWREKVNNYMHIILLGILYLMCIVH